MENLRNMGYKDAVNKKMGLTPDYVFLVMEEMAKYHASIYAYFKSFPNGLDGAKEKYRVNFKKREI